MTTSLLFLLLAITLTIFGQFFYKTYFATKKSVFVIISLICFILIPYCSYRALINIPIDVVYMSTPFSIVATALLAVVFLKEKLGKKEVYAMTIIIIGILLYNIDTLTQTYHDKF